MKPAGHSAGETPDFRNVLFLTDESSMASATRDMAELYQLVCRRWRADRSSSGDTAVAGCLHRAAVRLVQQRSAIDTVVMQEIVRRSRRCARQLKALSPGRWRHPFAKWMTSAHSRSASGRGIDPEKSVWKSASRKSQQDNNVAGERAQTLSSCHQHIPTSLQLSG
ncbi:hypothetical protein ACVXHA_17885 [Escherichia coli]